MYRQEFLVGFSFTLSSGIPSRFYSKITPEVTWRIPSGIRSIFSGFLQKFFLGLLKKFLLGIPSEILGTRSWVHPGKTSWRIPSTTYSGILIKISTGIAYETLSRVPPPYLNILFMEFLQKFCIHSSKFSFWVSFKSFFWDYIFPGIPSGNSAKKIELLPKGTPFLEGAWYFWMHARWIFFMNLR